MLMRNFKNSLRQKRGASLPMVLAIGMVLVIWVAGLMPIVTAQGTTTSKIKRQEERYLRARSAIEFTKGELVNLVEYTYPSTFAVVRDNESRFLTYNKTEEGLDYIKYVTSSNNPNENDSPNVDGNGTLVTVDNKQLAAICNVKEQDAYHYLIEIVTYDSESGQTDLTYSTMYTRPSDTGIIYPEAYRKTQALPISDFVVVDGKLGDDVLWHSSLTDNTDADGLYLDYKSYSSGKGSNFKYNAKFKEALLPMEPDRTTSFPAVLKTTPAVHDPDLPDYTKNQPDQLTYIAEPGIPALTYSYATDYYGDMVVTLTPNFSGTSYANTNTAKSYVLYGYSGTGAADIKWQTSNKITLENAGTYYFYCYVAGHVDTTAKNLYPDSGVAHAADPLRVFRFEGEGDSINVSSADEEYIMYGYSSRNGYRYLKNAEQSGSLSGGQSSKLLTGSIRTGMQVYDPNAGMEWTVSGKNSEAYFYGEAQALRFNDGNEDAEGDEIYTFGNNPTELVYDDGNIYVEKDKIVIEIKKEPIYEYIFGIPIFTGKYKETKVEKEVTYTYYLDIMGGGDFVSDDDVNVYFEPINVPYADEISSPERQTIAVPSVTLGEEISLDLVREKYKTAFSGSSSVKIYIIDGAVEGDKVFDVYAAGKKGNLPWLIYVCSITLPDYEEVSGYGFAASSMYFMGTTNNVAINTATIDADGAELQATISLKTDLLVIRAKDISNGGDVYVYPYSEGKTKTLVFFPRETSSSVFESFQFYEIPSGTNLMDLSASEAESYRCGRSTKTGDNWELPEKVLRYSRNGDYPTLNLDIAYATNEQLGHLVSGESTGWTENGKMKASSDKTANAMFVVCPYITQMEGAVTRSANRIMIAAEGGELTVPGATHFYARYVSFSNHKLIQGAAQKPFQVSCLTKNDDFRADVMDGISELLGTEGDYNSGTLQVEYEQDTMIFPTGSENGKKLKAQICRYADGTDLFALTISNEGEAEDVAQNQQLMVPYSTSELNAAFRDGYKTIETISTVERYITITGADKDTGNVEAELNVPTKLPALSLTHVGCSLDLYANYIKFDSNVTSIKLDRYRNPLSGYVYGDITVNTQESGYTENEYLGFFKTNVSDAYNYTIVQVDAASGITVQRGGESVLLKQGFYQIHAKVGGTSLYDVAKSIVEKGEESPYYIDEKSLPKYTQSLGDNKAYVDMGLETTEVTIAGFTGGSLK